MSDDQQTPDQDPVDRALGQMHEALGDAVEARLNEGGSDA